MTGKGALRENSLPCALHARLCMVTPKPVLRASSCQTGIRRLFIGRIESITWCNKVAPETLNAAKDRCVSEIEVIVIAIALNQQNIDPRVLQLIGRGYPCRLLFVCSFCHAVQLRMGLREQSGTKADAFRALLYCLVMQIAGNVLDVREDTDLKTAINGQIKILKHDGAVA